MRERERKRKKNRKEVRERTERVTETETLIILSSCSPWWWGSPQKIIESSGWIYAQARWECPGENAQVLPQARGSLTVSCLLQQSLDLLQYFRGSLMDYDTSSAASHVNVPWMWPVGWGFHSCEGGWGLRSLCKSCLWELWSLPTQTKPGMIFCCVWLSYGCILFLQPCLLLPRP